MRLHEIIPGFLSEERRNPKKFSISEAFREGSTNIFPYEYEHTANEFTAEFEDPIIGDVIAVFMGYGPEHRSIDRVENYKEVFGSDYVWYVDFDSSEFGYDVAHHYKDGVKRSGRGPTGVKVLNTVIQIIHEWIRLTNPKSFVFTTYGKKRINAYTSLCYGLSKSTNYTAFVPEKGGDEFYMIRKDLFPKLEIEEEDD